MVKDVFFVLCLTGTRKTHDSIDGVIRIRALQTMQTATDCPCLGSPLSVSSFLLSSHTHTRARTHTNTHACCTRPSCPSFPNHSLLTCCCGFFVYIMHQSWRSTLVAILITLISNLFIKELIQNPWWAFFPLENSTLHFSKKKKKRKNDLLQRQPKPLLPILVLMVWILHLPHVLRHVLLDHF